MDKFIEYTNYYVEPGFIPDNKVLVEYAMFIFNVAKIPTFPIVSSFKVETTKFEIIRNSTFSSKIKVTEFGFDNNETNRIREVTVPNMQAYDFVLTILKYMKGVWETNLIDWEVDFELKQRSGIWDVKDIDAREIICFSKGYEPIIRLTKPCDERTISSIYKMEEDAPGFDETKVLESILRKCIRIGGS